LTFVGLEVCIIDYLMGKDSWMSAGTAVFEMYVISARYQRSCGTEFVINFG
jgi:hypothetical protein